MKKYYKIDEDTRYRLMNILERLICDEKHYREHHTASNTDSLHGYEYYFKILESTKECGWWEK